MRIISGKYKGRLIKPPKGFKARPTTDFAKENLFNILSNNINFSEMRILDLFSGTGSISYEFASRGCLSVVTVESNYKHHLFIKKTIEALGIIEIKAVKSDVFKYLKWCKDKFDIIFADPPYNLKNLELIPDLIFEYQMLTKNGYFILEHGDKSDFKNHPEFKEIRKYGGVNFSIFT